MRNEGRHACAALVLTALASGTSAVETPGRLRAQGKESVYAYAELAKGREVFDAFRALAPGAELRYRLYPHPPRQGVGLAWRDGGGAKGALRLAGDNSFTMAQLAGLERRNAWLVASLPPAELSWRPVVRSSGLPANVRRLGDLRLSAWWARRAGSACAMSAKWPACRRPMPCARMMWWLARGGPRWPWARPCSKG